MLEEALVRKRREIESLRAPWVTIQGKTCRSFSSNDYLGLRQHPAVIAIFQKTAEEYGVGSGASPMVSGFSSIHRQLEEILAAWTNHERALLFSNGYMANLAVLTTLPKVGDCILLDRHCHASLLDGARFSAASWHRYRHGDLCHLAQQLEKYQKEKIYLVSDGVFSMDGDFPDLTQWRQQIAPYQVLCLIDDSHGLGVMGEQGAGITVGHSIDLLTGSFGKALGTAGGFVAGSASQLEVLFQRARPYIYDTAMPTAVAAATMQSIQIIQREPERREQLQMNIQYFHRCAQQTGLSFQLTQTPIQRLFVGCEAQTVFLSEQLLARGFWLYPMRHPTVLRGAACLRITLTVQHSPADIDALITALMDVYASREWLSQNEGVCEIA